MNHYRCQNSKGMEKLVPIVVYRIYNKYFEYPELSEGFDSIIKIPFSINNSFNKLCLNYVYIEK